MKFKQRPHSVLMIRPASFGFNTQTAESNTFQQLADGLPEVQAGALQEFDRMVDVLEAHEVTVQRFNDTPLPAKPDAVFPNNWISFHESGAVVLYPMLAENRRLERRPDIVEELRHTFVINDVIDLAVGAIPGQYLEGTGSIVFDHENRMAYACRSPRTSEALVSRLCHMLQYKPVIFNAFDENNIPVYHTNVVMSVAEKFVVVCLDAITNEQDQEVLLEHFSNAGKKVIAISFAQMRAFAGNMLEVETRNREPLVLLSQQAMDSLLPGQLNAISQFSEVLPLKIDTLEKVGGGSVRCMIAGIHLAKRNTV